MLLAKPRIKSEHCIGLMRGPFPWLHNIQIRIKGRKDLRWIVEHVRVCVSSCTMLSLGPLMRKSGLMNGFFL
jgi:hypothetical protein